MDESQVVMPTHFFEALQFQCHLLIVAVTSTPDGTKLMENAKADAGKTTEWAQRKWAFATMIQTMEDDSLRSMQHTSVRMGRPIDTLMFDGGHVRKTSVGETAEDVEPLLRAMEADCADKFKGPGLRIQLIVKPFPDICMSTMRKRGREEAAPDPETEAPLDDETEGPAKRRRLEGDEDASEGESDLGPTSGSVLLEKSVPSSNTRSTNWA